MATFDGDPSVLRVKLLQSRPKFERSDQVRIWDIVTSDPGPMSSMLVKGTYDQAVDYAFRLVQRRADSWEPTCTVTINDRPIMDFSQMPAFT